MNIDLLSQIQKKYYNKGYKPINIPWIVSKEAYYSINPNESFNLKLNDDYIITSAEQGFAQLLIDGKINNGKYSAVFSSYKKEVIQNDFCIPYSMKLDLINILNPHSKEIESKQLVLQLCKEALFIFSNLSLYRPNICDNYYCNFEFVEVEPDFNSLYKFNILEKLTKLKIGSYGLRKYNSHKWIYGTGLVEPLFDEVKIKSFEKSQKLKIIENIIK